jgi:uncharacterized protein (TIGR02757 family)
MAMMNNETRERLIALAERYETADFIVGDPSWWMHQVEGERNQEAMAFVASALSYGSRSQFMPKIGQLLEWAGGDMEGWLRSGAYREHFTIGDKQCFYRLYNNDTMRRFFDAYSELLATHGSMKEYVSGTALQAVNAICRWFAEHDGGGVVPKDTTSACKRVCMFLRWMVRDGSPVDLGLWKDIIDKRTLIMPLDTHVVSEAMKLGLLQSRCASMSAALRLTDAMREAFPDDPLRGDFALFGYGVDGL